MSRTPPFFRSRQNSQSAMESSRHRRNNSSGRPATAGARDTVHRSQSSAAVPTSGPSSTRGIMRFEMRRSMEQTHFLHSKARFQNLNPPIDMRLLDYVGPSDENLMCPICRCPFVDPVVLTECDHCFCRDCIRQTWTTSATPYNPLGPRGDCPTCRTPAKLGLRSSTSKILINILDDLVVKCPKSDQGCTAVVKRGEVQDHVSIYCGYALIECPAEDCDLPVLRKEASQGCLHFGVSCIACREEMQRSNLESHWRSSCPDRKVTCELCKSDVFHRELDEHTQQSCPATSVPCPGKGLGCTTRSKRNLAEVHAKSCTFAKLAPIIGAQRQRLDEQEAAQKQMSRKLEVLEDGFAAMQSILFPKGTSPTPGEGTNEPDEATASASAEFDAAHLESVMSPTSTIHSMHTALGDPTPRSRAGSPDAQSFDLAAPYSEDGELSFPPPSTTGGPYTSPLHHLLSMHESLRDEMARVHSTLRELDGRHTMQIVNENMRTREDVTYLAAQVAALQRQVHWLTSTQLQRQQGRGANGEPSSSVESAVSAVNTAVRSAARMVQVGTMRRQGSEEGRTKL